MEPTPRNELFNRTHRKFDRYQVRVGAEIEWCSTKVWGNVTDISREGMFIEVANPPHIGSSFVVYLALNVPIRLDCVVRHVALGRRMGVTVSVDESVKQRFEGLLLALASGADPALTSVKSPHPEELRTMVKA